MGDNAVTVEFGCQNGFAVAGIGLGGPVRIHFDKQPVFVDGDGNACRQGQLVCLPVQLVEQAGAA